MYLLFSFHVLVWQNKNNVLYLNVAPAPPVISPAKATKSKGNKGNKAKKLTKEDISTPSDFRHVNHVGWHPNSGFDVSNVCALITVLFCF